MKVLVKTANIAFLSCLCGSEDQDGDLRQMGKFLSCLCGSEGDILRGGDDLLFLSCLCGSEAGKHD